MHGTLSANGFKTLDGLLALEDTIKDYLRDEMPIPLDLIAQIEEYGFHINAFIERMDNEVYGESNFYDSHWGS